MLIGSEARQTPIDTFLNLKVLIIGKESWVGGGEGRQRDSVGARATAERSEAVRGAEGAEKPL